MKLSKQLYLLISIILFMVFVGNFYISVKNTKEYLSTEISTKAQDSATMLGMTLKNIINDKSDPEIKLILNAISDSGFYKEIRLEDVSYKIDNQLIFQKLEQNDVNIKDIISLTQKGKIISDDTKLLEQQLSSLYSSENEQVSNEKSDNYIFVPNSTLSNEEIIQLKIVYENSNKELLEKIIDYKLNKVIYFVEREVKFDNVPKWFIDYFKFDLKEKSSLINNGWENVAIIFVSPNPGIAYDKLYTQLVQLSYNTLVAFLVAMILFTIFIQLILNPLKLIEKLAIKISNGKFGVIDKLPWTQELKNVSIAMNNMSNKIEEIINGLNKNIEETNEKLSQDNLTKLFNKSSFMTDMKELFSSQSSGYVFLIKIPEFTDFASKNGRNFVDDFIKDFASVLKDIENRYCYRFYGSEFVFISPYCDVDKAKNISLLLKEKLEELSKKYNKEDIFHLGAIPFNKYSSISDVLAGVNEAYELSKLIGPNESLIKEKNEFARGMLEWKEIVSSAIDNNKIILNYDINLIDNNTHQTIAKEVFSTIKDSRGEIVPIGVFISVAQELKRIVDFDKLVIKNVIEKIKSDSSNCLYAVNISLDSLLDSGFLFWIEKTLKADINISNKLVFCLASYSIKNNIDEFNFFTEMVKKFGSKTMIKRYEIKFINIEQLKSIKPNIIRLPKEYTTGIAKDNEKISLVDSICKVSHILEIVVFVEEIEDKDDDEKIKSLGIDGGLYKTF